MLSAEVQADLLILMSDVDGIYNKPPWEDGAKLMHTYTSNDRHVIEFGKKSKVSCLRNPNLTAVKWSPIFFLCVKITDLNNGYIVQNHKRIKILFISK